MLNLTLTAHESSPTGVTRTFHPRQSPLILSRGSKTAPSSSAARDSPVFYGQGAQVMSKSHAQLSWRTLGASAPGGGGGGWWIKDLGSTNGTLLSRHAGKAVTCAKGQAIQVEAGDVITLGRKVDAKNMDTGAGASLSFVVSLAPVGGAKPAAVSFAAEATVGEAPDSGYDSPDKNTSTTGNSTSTAAQQTLFLPPTTLATHSIKSPTRTRATRASAAELSVAESKKSPTSGSHRHSAAAASHSRAADLSSESSPDPLPTQRQARRPNSEKPTSIAPPKSTKHSDPSARLPSQDSEEEFQRSFQMELTQTQKREKKEWLDNQTWVTQAAKAKDSRRRGPPPASQVVDLTLSSSDEDNEVEVNDAEDEEEEEEEGNQAEKRDDVQQSPPSLRPSPVLLQRTSLHLSSPLDSAHGAIEQEVEEIPDLASGQVSEVQDEQGSEAEEQAISPPADMEQEDESEDDHTMIKPVLEAEREEEMPAARAESTPPHPEPKYHTDTISSPGGVLTVSHGEDEEAGVPEDHVVEESEMGDEERDQEAEKWGKIKQEEGDRYLLSLGEEAAFRRAHGQLQDQMDDDYLESALSQVLEEDRYQEYVIDVERDPEMGPETEEVFQLAMEGLIEDAWQLKHGGFLERQAARESYLRSNWEAELASLDSEHQDTTLVKEIGRVQDFSHQQDLAYAEDLMGAGEIDECDELEDEHECDPFVAEVDDFEAAELEDEFDEHLPDDWNWDVVLKVADIRAAEDREKADDSMMLAPFDDAEFVYAYAPIYALGDGKRRALVSTNSTAIIKPSTRPGPSLARLPILHQKRPHDLIDPSGAEEEAAARLVRLFQSNNIVTPEPHQSVDEVMVADPVAKTVVDQQQAVEMMEPPAKRRRVNVKHLLVSTSVGFVAGAVAVFTALGALGAA